MTSLLNLCFYLICRCIYRCIFITITIIFRIPFNMADFKVSNFVKVSNLKSYGISIISWRKFLLVLFCNIVDLRVVTKLYTCLSSNLGEPTSYFSNKWVKFTSSSIAGPQPHTLARSLPVPRGKTDTHTRSAWKYQKVKSCNDQIILECYLLKPFLLLNKKVGKIIPGKISWLFKVQN